MTLKIEIGLSRTAYKMYRTRKNKRRRSKATKNVERMTESRKVETVAQPID